MLDDTSGGSMREGKRTLQMVAVLMLAVSSSMTACRVHVSDDVPVTRSQALDAPPPEADIQFDLLFPSSLGLNDVAVGASEQLEVGPHSQILGALGSGGRISSVGANAGWETTVGPGTSVGDIASLPPVVLAPKANAGSVRSSGSITLKPNAHATSVTSNASLTPLARRQIRVHPPSGPAVHREVAPHALTTLAPGRYSRIAMGPHSKATLSAGTYLVDDFALGASSELALDTTQGTVFLYIKTSATWLGTVTGDATRFVLGYLGEGTLDLKGRARGTTLVPWGTLNLGPSQDAHEGRFYGKRVVLAPNSVVRETSTPFLIDSVRVSRDTMCAGEQAEVQVSGATAQPGTTVRILGAVGSHHFVQFDGAPGPRFISAAIFAPDGKADFMSVPVRVMACPRAPDAPPPVGIHFRAGTGRPNVVEFDVVRFGEDGYEKPMSGPATYQWSFGDGTTLTTTSAVAIHDYSAATNALSEYNTFTTSLVVTTSLGASTAQKVVPIWSLYAANRAKGVVRPPMRLRVEPSAYQATLTNLEPAPLSITEGRVDFAPCDPALPIVQQPPQVLAAEIPALGSGSITIPAPRSVPRDVCGVTVHAFGTTASGTVYGTAYTRVGENTRLARAVTNPDTVALLDQASSMTVDPNRFDELELRQLVVDGRLPRLPPAVPPGTTYADEGAECTPGDVSSPPGLVCQPTNDWVAIPSEIINAFRGEIVMEHGCGPIAQLLASINQKYSHEAIFTKRGVETRHSTAVSERFEEAVDVGRLRLDPNKMKYLFPGTDGRSSTVSVSQLVDKYVLPDPEDPTKTWEIGGAINVRASQCASDAIAVAPVMVRPPPNAAPDKVRAISAIAERGGEGCSSHAECASGSCDLIRGLCNPGSIFSIDSHYRFFMFSHAEVTLPGVFWASGKESTVSSTFMHLAPARAGLPLRPTARFPSIPDGMRLYSLDERTVGANTMWINTSNDVRKACRFLPVPGAVVMGGLAGLIGGPDGVTVGLGLGAQAGEALCAELQANIANQVTNCFASDACDDLDRTWESPGTGGTASPDDILAWDLPRVGGSYGYNEPAQFLPTVFRRRYAWRKEDRTGTITIKVVNEANEPFEGARVTLNGIQVGGSDATGTVVARDVAAGAYDVEAQFSPCGQFIPPPQVPSPPAPTSLPLCPREGPVPPVCQSGFNRACPNGFRTADCEERCNVPQPSDCPEHTICRCDLTCACAAEQPPACNQPLLRAAKPATLAPDGNITVFLTLCAGPPVHNGSRCQRSADCPFGNSCELGYCVNPAGCRQRCETDADCFNILRCNPSTKICEPKPSFVDIAGGIELQAYDHDLLQDPTRTRYSLFTPLRCEPSVNGGDVGFSYCGKDADGDDAIQYVFSAHCIQDPTNGFFTILSDARLDKGCGTNAELRNNTASWTVTLPPPTESTPAPSSGPYNGASCWGAADCSENHAMFSYRYTSRFRP